MAYYTADCIFKNDMDIIKLNFDIMHNNFEKAGEASSSLKNTLKQIGYPPEKIRRIVVSAYEAEMNVVVHSLGGRMEIQITPEQVNVRVSDCGPGIENVEEAMKEGYSTASDKVREMGFGAGMGLPNIKKNTDELKIESSVPNGTVVSFSVKRE